MAQDEANPLLASAPLPEFGSIRPEHAVPAIGKIVDENRAWVRSLDLPEPGTDNLLLPLEQADVRLSESFSPVRHLRAVCDSPQWREAHQECQNMIVQYATEMAHDVTLYETFKALKEGPSWQSLADARKSEVEHVLRDFRLGGVSLPKDQKKIFAEKEQKLAQLCAEFTNNVADAVAAWELLLPDDARLDGLLPSQKAMLRADAEAHGSEGFRVSLQPPAVEAILRHANDRALREEVFRAHVTRASDQGPNAGAFDNTSVIEEILKLRHEQAKLLGFDSIAEQALATRMAQTPQEVLDFLQGLVGHARERTEQEWQEMREYARGEGIDDLARWDVGWASERMRREQFDLREEELRPYFSADATIGGLLDLASELFDLDITRREDVAVWHEDVRFYEIRDREGAVRGQFYLDPYARPNKHGGAWMDTCAQRRRDADGVHPAVAYLTCNGAPPAGGAPALFSHNDVVTLFHEFGHGLHHMLTKVDCVRVGGIEGVEWDAVEWPSQWMENWCWEPEILQRFARHYETGEPIPPEVAQRLKRSRSFHSGIALMRQLELALFDFRLHCEYAPGRGAGIAELWAEIRGETGGVETPDFVRTAHSFEHIFSGGYTAGYYSYKWAEVLSADTFAAFREGGLPNRDMARRFERCVLSAGGVRPAAEMFREFRGRAPEPDALLEQDGLLA